MIFTPDTIEFKLCRGDTFVLPIVLNEGTQLDFKQYTLQDSDKLYIAILEPNQSFEDAIVKKVLTKDSYKDNDGNVILKLLSQDTQRLMTGMYYITIKLRQPDKVTTVLPMKKFWITGTNPPRKIVETPVKTKIILDGGEIE